MGYPESKLIQDVCTRWNSTYDIFQRCMDIKKPLMSTIAIIGNMDSLVHENFEIIKHYCVIFKPFKEVSTSTSVNTPTSEAIVELDRYLNESILDRKSDPLKWWNDGKKMYPNLFDLMLLLLCVPSTSVLSERTFSKVGYIISERRNGLSTKNTEMLIFLNSIY
ncbi:Ribonuclease H-like domain,HAT, C-terminal dimerisation domain [Cinara cedri]|uniref:Ribonuclease H-like domain,HAT, C-terminal dimerisation domain n=1 Tax=Cinara cedri TaxID=506608 RepID=A0A5E4MG31_9HEMI|nr:Ribonuclease H-like domain,HAT, C-terminal dimerisation domain [Cinara cedri]